VSVSKKDLRNPEIARRVVELYLQDRTKPTVADVAAKVGVTQHTCAAILRRDVDAPRLVLEKKLRYSRSKLGSANPMLGKKGEAHPRWQGACSDNKGYLTLLVGEVRYFVHRIVMAEALGLLPDQLPERFVVHHIDENPLNNSIDNLALCTQVGHPSLHQKRAGLARLPLWVQWLSTTSK
jgi:hypothetical protein